MAGIPPQQALYVHNLNDKLQKEELKRALYLLFSQYGPLLIAVLLAFGSPKFFRNNEELSSDLANTRTTSDSFHKRGGLEAGETQSIFLLFQNLCTVFCFF